MALTMDGALLIKPMGVARAVVMKLYSAQFIPYRKKM